MRLLISAALMLLAATFHASAQSAVPPDVLKDLAPTGKLRAAINFGNSVLAQKGKDGGPQGVTADLSRELAKRLGVEVSFVTSRRPARCSRRPKPAPGMSASSPSSRCAPPTSSSPRR